MKPVKSAETPLRADDEKSELMSGALYRAQLRALQFTTHLLVEFNEPIIVGLHTHCYGGRIGGGLGKHCDG